MVGPKIFISYRRSPELADESSALWLHDKLEAANGEVSVFHDRSDSDQLIARPFREALMEKLGDCTACVVVIGPKWIDDIPRLHSEDDVVRQEIEAALSREGIKIVPLTVGGVSLPSRVLLPESIRGLLDYGGHSLSLEHPAASAEKLKRALGVEVPVEAVDAPASGTSAIHSHDAAADNAGSTGLGESATHDLVSQSLRPGWRLALKGAVLVLGLVLVISANVLPVSGLCRILPNNSGPCDEINSQRRLSDAIGLLETAISKFELETKVHISTEGGGS